MKSQVFLSHLAMIITTDNFMVNGEKVTVKSRKENILTCEKDGKEVEVVIDNIKATKQTVGAFYNLTSETKSEDKSKKKTTKKKSTKKVEPTEGDKE